MASVTVNGQEYGLSDFHKTEVEAALDKLKINQDTTFETYTRGEFTNIHLDSIGNTSFKPAKPPTPSSLQKKTTLLEQEIGLLEEELKQKPDPELIAKEAIGLVGLLTKDTPLAERKYRVDVFVALFSERSLLFNQKLLQLYKKTNMRDFPGRR